MLTSLAVPPLGGSVAQDPAPCVRTNPVCTSWCAELDTAQQRRWHHGDEHELPPTLLGRRPQRVRVCAGRTSRPAFAWRTPPAPTCRKCATTSAPPIDNDKLRRAALERRWHHARCRLHGWWAGTRWRCRMSPPPPPPAPVCVHVCVCARVCACVCACYGVAAAAVGASPMPSSASTAMGRAQGECRLGGGGGGVRRPRAHRQRPLATTGGGERTARNAGADGVRICPPSARAALTQLVAPAKPWCGRPRGNTPPICAKGALTMPCPGHTRLLRMTQTLCQHRDVGSGEAATHIMWGRVQWAATRGAWRG